MTIAPDPFGLALHQLADQRKQQRRDTPTTSSTGAAPVAVGDVISISDPVKYALAALTRTTDTLREATHGSRNEALYNAALSLGNLVAGGLLNEQQATAHLENTADQLWPDRDMRNVRGTVNSGLRNGMTQPLRWTQAPPLAPIPAAAPFQPVIVDGQAAPIVAPAPDPADFHHLAVQSEAATLRARREARRLVDAEEAALTFRVPPSRPSLVEELQIEDAPIAYAIDDLLPAGGNALLTAQYKAGKTSTVNNLVRAFCDGDPFLGKYPVNPAPGRIAVFNYEVGDDLYRRWLRELNIQQPDRAVVLNLRGFRLPITVPSVEDWVVQWLQDHEVSFWIVDPFARAFTGCGDNENDNGQVGVFLDTLDVIKARAGVRDLILPTHTGRAEAEQGQERSRGATRLEDWADVRWLLTQVEGEEGQPPQRFFRATGRNVEVGESALLWNEADRSQTHTGGDRKWMERRRREQLILDYINANQGCSFRAIKEAIGGKDDLIRTGLRSLENAGCIGIDRSGATHKHTGRRLDVVDAQAPAATPFEAVA